MLRKIKKYIKNLFLFVRDGGVSYVNISYVNPSEQFVGKKIVITGGTSGLGLAIAKSFLSEGATVLICARNKDRINNLLKEEANSRLFGLEWDISIVNQVKDKIEIASKMLDGVDVFINCAGVSAYNGDDKSEEMYDFIVDINMKGLYFMCKAEGDYFMNNRIQGKIINITSKAGEIIATDPYTMSKWGANAITQGFARKLSKYHINVNGIAPGCVPTNITAELQSHKDSDNQFRKEHNTKRFTMPEEIAYVANFLASDSAKNIVGQIIAVDGGIYI